MAHWRDFLDADARSSRYLGWKEVARSTGLSRTTAWRLQKRDDFPAPYALSPGRVAYREDEIEAWRISRGPSGARPRPAPEGSRADGNPRPSPSEDAPALGVGVRPAEASPAARSEEQTLRATQDGAPTAPLRTLPPGRRAKPGRRRSEHAKAIAQQIHFDF